MTARPGPKQGLALRPASVAPLPRPIRLCNNTRIASVARAAGGAGSRVRSSLALRRTLPRRQRDLRPVCPSALQLPCRFAPLFVGKYRKRVSPRGRPYHEDRLLRQPCRVLPR